MNKANEHRPGQDELAADPVWDLLRKSPAVAVNPAFADRVMRAVRVQNKPGSLWMRFFDRPAWTYSIAGLGAVAAALAVAAAFLAKPQEDAGVARFDVPPVNEFADLDEVASQEMLLAATDHLNEFSDTELVSLIGF